MASSQEPDLGTVRGVVFCYAGDPERGAKRQSRPLHALGSSLLEHLGPMAYPALQSALAGLYRPGHQWYGKGDFVKGAERGGYGNPRRARLANRHLRPETSLTETLQRLGNDGRLLVIGEGQRVQGALSRDELMRLLEVHRALST